MRLQKYLTEQSSLSPALVRQYQQRAENERKSGGYIEINYDIPTIGIRLSDGSEYFFQEHEAEELLKEVPENISAEDFLLSSSGDW